MKSYLKPSIRFGALIILAGLFLISVPLNDRRYPWHWCAQGNPRCGD